MIKGTLVLCLALFAVLGLRRQSAALRHRILAAAIVCAALVPLAEPLAPAWRLPVLAAASLEPSRPLTLTDETTQGGSVTTSTATARRTDFARLLPRLQTVWLAGAGIGLLFLAIGLARLARIARRARPVTDERWTAAAADLGARCGIARPLSLLQTAHPTLLFTWGIRHPRILLPAGACEWSDDRIRVVLGHELAHIRRGDWAMHLLAECVRCAYWFNPFAWIACHRLRLESEHACDDAVLRLGVEAPAYATELVDLARLFRRGRRALLPAPAMARPSDLERRIRIMLNPHLDRSPVGRLPGLIVLLVCVALTLSLAGLSLTAAAAPQVVPAVSPSASTAVPPAPAPAASPVPVSATPSPVAPAPAMAATAARPAPVPEPQAGQTADLVVTVMDELGRLVSNAVVTFSGAAPELNSEARTGPDGQLAGSGIPPGTYQVTVSKPGFKKFVMPDILLAAGKKTAVKVTLHLGSLQETVVVAATAGATPPGSTAPAAQQLPVPKMFNSCPDSPDNGCVIPPRKVMEAKPIYPPAYVASGTSGTVVIHARLLADGSVGDLAAEPGSDALFSAAAMDAIRLWMFLPVQLDGVPVAVDMTVTVRFEISR